MPLRVWRSKPSTPAATHWCAAVSLLTQSLAGFECSVWVSAGHCGPVYGLTRNPFYPKFFLSTGDWSVRVWNEDLRTPVITSRFMPAHLTSCRWSPSRWDSDCHPHGLPLVMSLMMTSQGLCWSLRCCMRMQGRSWS